MPNQQKSKTNNPMVAAPNQGSNELILGGEPYSVKDQYLQTITHMFYQINCAADGRDLNNLQWVVNYYTDVMISSILNRKMREEFQQAKSKIYELELEKIKTDENKLSLSQDDKGRAILSTCMFILGELKEYFDRYFGFEQQLAVFL